MASEIPNPGGIARKLVAFERQRLRAGKTAEFDRNRPDPPIRRSHAVPDKVNPLVGRKSKRTISMPWMTAGTVGVGPKLTTVPVSAVPRVTVALTRRTTVSMVSRSVDRPPDAAESGNSIGEGDTVCHSHHHVCGLGGQEVLGIRWHGLRSLPKGGTGCRSGPDGRASSVRRTHPPPVSERRIVTRIPCLGAPAMVGSDCRNFRKCRSRGPARQWSKKRSQDAQWEATGKTLGLGSRMLRHDMAHHVTNAGCAAL